MKKLILITLSFLFVASVQGASVPLNWKAAHGAAGYKVYKFVMPLCGEEQATWDSGLDVGNVTEYIYKGIPGTGLVLFRFGAYNNNGETIMTWSGPWFKGDEQSPGEVYGASIIMEIEAKKIQSLADKVEAIIKERQKEK